MIGAVLVSLIRLYQKILSPLKFPTCRFHPSCSEYCIEALRTRGAAIGVLLGIWRILRCNPFCRGGYDPVPPGRRDGVLPGRTDDVRSGQDVRQDAGKDAGKR